MNNNSNKIKSFTDLNAWKEAHKLVLMIYKITKNFPKEEIFGLTSQIRRAVISITSNIAEGFSRQTYKEKIQFYHIAKGSLTEVQDQLLIARDINYINKQDFNDIANQSVIVHKLLNGLIKKSKDIQNSKFKIQNSNNGFTLIELIIVMVIIGIVTAIIVPSYNKARNNKDLLLGREQVSGDIRMAQNYSYNTLKFGAAFPEGGYGIHFDISGAGDPKKYIIFADINSDQEYDAGEESQELELPRSVKISSLKVDGSSMNYVDVVFKPPYGKVFIKSGGNLYAKLEIKIENNDGETRTIEAEDSGLIN